MMSPGLKQTWVSSGTFVNNLCAGMVLAYPSSLLPGLRAADSPVQVDLEAASWLASCVGVAAVPAFLLSSYLMGTLGRKKAQLIFQVLMIAGWVLLYAGSGFTSLLGGRVLGGMSSAAHVLIGAVVIGEYSSPTSRGTFLNLKTTFVCVGYLIIHVLGHYFEFGKVALFSTFPAVVSFLMTLTWPESPAWLLSKRRYQEAEDSWYWLRGRDRESIEEFESMATAQRTQTVEVKIVSVKQKVGVVVSKFQEKDFYKPLMVAFFGFALLETSGRHVFPAFATDILNRITTDKWQRFLYTISIDSITILSSTSSSVLVRMVKRRTLLFISGFAAVIVILFISLYLYLSSNGTISSDRPWIPVLLLMLYFVLTNLGCSPIPIALMGEIFPLRHRSIASAIAGVFGACHMTIVLEMTPKLINVIEVYGTFVTFAVVTSLALGILYFILPETKDRTLQEIEDYFNNGRFGSYKENVEVNMKMLEMSDDKEGLKV